MTGLRIGSPGLRVVRAAGAPAPDTPPDTPAVPAATVSLPDVAAPPPEPAPMTLEQARGIVAAAGKLPRCGRCSIPYGWLSEEGAEDHRALHRARRTIATAVDARSKTAAARDDAGGPPCLGGDR